MLPPDGVLLAARHWVQLLGRGESVVHAWALIRSSPSTGGLSATQYATALEWLRDLSLIGQDGRLWNGTAHSSTRAALFARCVCALGPAWLRDADVLISAPTELPTDAERIAEVFGVDERSAFLAIQGAARKVDAEALQRIGRVGELALIELIEGQWPGSTRHVAEYDDSAGYDIAVNLPQGEWHIEVKTTTRRGRLKVHLTYNEYATGRFDGRWLLVVVGAVGDTLRALATLRTGTLEHRVSRNLHPKGRWEVCAIDLEQADLLPGLVMTPDFPDALLPWPSHGASEFVWLPTAYGAPGQRHWI